MYGVKKQQSRDKTPDITMNHLAAIAAIKIVNDGHGGDVVISNIEFKAPEAIVGTFKVSLNDNDNVSFEASTAATTARVELPSPTRIEYDKSITIYVPIKPFDASGKEITIAVNGTAVKDNGVSRSVTIPAGTKFQAGKVTTLKVPVNILSYHDENVDPATSNVLDETGTIVETGTTFIGTPKYEISTGNLTILSHQTPQSITINGKQVNAYVLGTASDLGYVTIRGTAQELLPYVPIEFYVSSFGDSKAVMRLESITAYFKSLSNVPITFKYENLYPSIIRDKSKITFDGIMPLTQVTYNQKNHSVILYEEPFHKPVSIKKIEDLLANFDDDKTDDKSGKKPTFAGLQAAIQNPSSLPSSSTPNLATLTSEKDITATIVYTKLKEKLSSNTLLKLVSAVLFSSPKKMFEMAADMPLEVTLSTVSKGTEGATDTRIIVWGLNSPNAND